MRFREVVLLALAVGTAGAARAAEPLALRAAVERALAHDADVRAAEAEVRAAKARLEGASALLASNPEVAAGVGPRDTGERRTIDYELAIRQPVEIAGQRGARVAAARAAVGAAEARLASTRARLVSQVRELLGRAAAAALRAGIAAEGHGLAEQAAKAAARRFEAGDAPRIEVNSARIELGRATRLSVDAEQDLLSARAELELALGVEPGSARELALEPPATSGQAERHSDALVQDALGARRDLAAARLDVDAAGAEESLARRSAVPSPTLGVSVAREENASIVLGTLSFEVPLFARRQAERGAASARVQQARAALGALERRVEQEVRLAAERVRAMRKTVAAFDEATTAALGENLALATKAYAAGQIDFVRYQLLRREALEARRDHVDAVEALNRAEAQLERALGREPAW